MVLPFFELNLFDSSIVTATIFSQIYNIHDNISAQTNNLDKSSSKASPGAH